MVHKHPLKQPSRRQLRVVQELKQAFSRILNEDLNVLDMEITSITVTDVQVSPDLKNATVYVTPLGGNSIRADELVEQLKEHVPHFRKELSHRIHMKYVPKIKFEADHGLDNLWLMDDALKSERVRRDVEKKEDDDTLN